MVLLCPVIKVTGKEPNPGRMTKGTDQSAVKVWVTFPGKEPRHAEVLADGKRNTECVVEEHSYKFHLRPCDQLQKQGL